MQFEREGITIWYGTPDAPAPEKAVHVGSKATITVGVKPVDASNRVKLIYRINQGPIETLVAKWIWNDPSGKAQYFRAHLPDLCAGDIVEYTAICRCAGRQVPSPGEAKRFASSFRVIELKTAYIPGRNQVSAFPIRSLTREGVPSSGRDISKTVTTTPKSSEITKDLNNVVTHKIIGQLVYEKTGASLAGYTVRAFDLDAGTHAKDLGYVITDTNGLFTLTYKTPRETLTNKRERVKAGRRLRLHIIDHQDKEIHRTEIHIKADQEKVLTIPVQDLISFRHISATSKLL